MIRIQEVHLNAYRNKELLDLLHGMSHTQVGLRYGCHHLDEHMQLHGQVSIFGLTALSQLFLLMKILNANYNIENTGCGNNVGQKGKHYKPCSCPSWNLYLELKSWHQSLPAVS